MRPLTLAECTRLDCIEAFRRAAELGYIEPGDITTYRRALRRARERAVGEMFYGGGQ